MRTHAQITSIHKVAPDIYSTYTGFAVTLRTRGYGTIDLKIADVEACALTVGESVWVDAGWNEDGNGCFVRLGRPIQVVTSAQK